VIITSTTPGASTTQKTKLAGREQALHQSFENAVADLIKRGASNDFVQKVQQHQQRFVELLEQAEQTGGDAKAFLRSLAADDRTALQQVHGIGEPITDSMIEQMTDEGAANLLRMRDDGRDSDNNGLTDVGISSRLMFPHPSTPADVTAAWEKTMEGLSGPERLLAEGMMIFELMSANRHINENGQLHRAEPGDLDWVNPFNSDFDYQDWTKKRIEYLDSYRNLMSAEQYERGMRFAQTFLENLQAERAG